MKKILTRYVLVVLALFAIKTTQAQDFHFSQYYAAPLTLNPALTGQFNGQYRGFLNYRSQYSSITADPYQTAHASFDLPVGERVGLGLDILDQTAGSAGYNDLQAMASVSYDLPIGVDKYNHIVFGAQLGVINKSFNPNSIKFGDQYNAGLGLTPTAENFDRTSRFIPDANAGLMFYDGNPFKYVNYFVGVTAFHLPALDQSFSGASVFSTSGVSPRYRRFLAHGGARIKPTRLLEVSIQAMGSYQNSAYEIIPGAAIQYHVTEADIYLLAGASYRIDDAIVPYVGVQFKEYALGLSYDVTVSDLDAVNQSKGGFEISLSYIRKPKVTRPKFICPRI